MDYVKLNTYPTAARHPPTTLRVVIFSSIGCISGLSGNDLPGSEDLRASGDGDGERSEAEEGEFMIVARR
jgi:hypothetical protein